MMASSGRGDGRAARQSTAAGELRGPGRGTNPAMVLRHAAMVTWAAGETERVYQMLRESDEERFVRGLVDLGRLTTLDARDRALRLGTTLEFDP